MIYNHPLASAALSGGNTGAYSLIWLWLRAAMQWTLTETGWLCPSEKPTTNCNRWQHTHWYGSSSFVNTVGAEMCTIAGLPQTFEQRTFFSWETPWLNVTSTPGLLKSKASIVCQVTAQSGRTESSSVACFDFTSCWFTCNIYQQRYSLPALKMRIRLSRKTQWRFKVLCVEKWGENNTKMTQSVTRGRGDQQVRCWNIRRKEGWIDGRTSVTDGVFTSGGCWACSWGEPPAAARRRRPLGREEQPVKQLTAQQSLQRCFKEVSGLIDFKLISD